MSSFTSNIVQYRRVRALDEFIGQGLGRDNGEGGTQTPEVMHKYRASHRQPLCVVHCPGKSK